MKDDKAVKQDEEVEEQEQQIEQTVEQIKIEELEEKVEEFEAKYKRAIADYQNLEKWMREQRGEWMLPQATGDNSSGNSGPPPLAPASSDNALVCLLKINVALVKEHQAVNTSYFHEDQRKCFKSTVKV